MEGERDVWSPDDEGIANRSKRQSPPCEIRATRAEKGNRSPKDRFFIRCFDFDLFCIVIE